MYMFKSDKLFYTTLITELNACPDIFSLSKVFINQCNDFRKITDWMGRVTVPLYSTSCSRVAHYCVFV